MFLWSELDRQSGLLLVVSIDSSLKPTSLYAQNLPRQCKMLYGIKDFAAPALLTFTGSPQAGKQSQLSGQFIGSFGIIYAGALPKKPLRIQGIIVFLIILKF